MSATLCCIAHKRRPKFVIDGALLIYSGPLEPTNEWYDIAKFPDLNVSDVSARIRLQLDLTDADQFGPGDNFDLQNPHVLLR